MFVYHDSLKCTVADFKDALAIFSDSAAVIPTLYVGNFSWVIRQPAIGLHLPVILSNCLSAPDVTSVFSR